MQHNKTTAVVFEKPGQLSVRDAELRAPEAHECLVEAHWSGISTGTERLMLTGDMPPFPGLGYPLVPGYETVGTVVKPSKNGAIPEGTRVFVPGGTGFINERNLFGGSAKHIVSAETRLVPLPGTVESEAVLLALAATARHILRRLEQYGPPELIIGHGVLGQLLARLTVALHGTRPTVWERDPSRRGQATQYDVCAMEEDKRSDYGVVCDVSGSADALNQMIKRCRPGATAVLAGFYMSPPTFDFAPAFMREINILISAEWKPKDLEEAAGLVASGRLDLSNLISEQVEASEAQGAYDTAFNESSCLKMVIDWRSI